MGVLRNLIRVIHSAESAPRPNRKLPGYGQTRQMHELSEPVVHRKDQLTRSLEITVLAAAKVGLDETDINSGHRNSPSNLVSWLVLPSRGCQAGRVDARK
jgi:hypothetical protein